MGPKNDSGLRSSLVVFGYTFPFTRLVVVIHIIIMLYALAFWIQIGVNPWLTKKLGVDSTVYGYLETTFAVLQLCGTKFNLSFLSALGSCSKLLNHGHLNNLLSYFILT